MDVTSQPDERAYPPAHLSQDALSVSGGRRGQGRSEQHILRVRDNEAVRRVRQVRQGVPAAAATDRAPRIRYDAVCRVQRVRHPDRLPTGRYPAGVPAWRPESHHLGLAEVNRNRRSRRCSSSSRCGVECARRRSTRRAADFAGSIVPSRPPRARNTWVRALDVRCSPAPGPRAWLILKRRTGTADAAEHRHYATSGSTGRLHLPIAPSRT